MRFLLTMIGCLSCITTHSLAETETNPKPGQESEVLARQGDSSTRSDLSSRLRVVDRGAKRSINTPIRAASGSTLPSHVSVPAGETHPFGDIVYQNNSSTFLLPVGIGARVADDIETICVSSDMVFLLITTSGGGDGTGPGYSFTTQLWDRCPSNGGVPLAGTLRTVELLNDGGWSTLVSFADTPVHVPRSFWISLEFSTASAGVYVGDPTIIGHSNDVIDEIFPCVTSFGGCDTGAPCANIALTVFALNCIPSFVAYQAQTHPFFYLELTGGGLVADDIVPTTAVAGLCDLASYAPGMSGIGVPFCAFTEIWSNDDANLRPLAPVPGTQTDYCNGGEGIFDPPVTIPTPVFWMTYQLDSEDAGPILVRDFPEIGFSEDCFAIYGNPEPDVFSQCVWFYGGCPLLGNPCATFVNTIVCAGEEPKGACCDPILDPESSCRNDVPVSQCSGRFAYAATCDNAPFDPPCNTSACCLPNGELACENLTKPDCSDQQGLWTAGAFCGVGEFACPTPSVCLTSDNDCFEAAPQFEVGCNLPTCCMNVCNIDLFCCEVWWDDTCAALAQDGGSCYQHVPPTNDDCSDALFVIDGTYAFTTEDATTDGGALPPHCAECFECGIFEDVWFDFMSPVTGTATISLCEDTSFDTNMAVFIGCDCPPDNDWLADCNDDGCGDPLIIGGPSNVTIPVHAGTCYKIRIGAWAFFAPGGEGVLTIETTADPNCPSGPVAFVDPLSGVVDARHPRPVVGGPQHGIRSFVVDAPMGAEPECFRHCQAASISVPDNSIDSVVSVGLGQYMITLEHPTAPHAVTRIAYDPQGGSSTVGTFISHPGNVNGDSVSGATDILALIDCLNGVNLTANCPWGIYSTDIDRSGQFNPADILRLIDMLAGDLDCGFLPCPPAPSMLPNGECEP